MRSNPWLIALRWSTVCSWLLSQDSNLPLITDAVTAAIDSGRCHLLICKGGCPKGVDLFNAALCRGASPSLRTTAEVLGIGRL